VQLGIERLAAGRIQAAPARHVEVLAACAVAPEDEVQHSSLTRFSRLDQDDARPVTEDQKKAKRSALSKSDESRPSKSKNPRLHRRTERNVETDFRTGIGDSKGRRRGGIGGDDDDDD